MPKAKMKGQEGSSEARGSVNDLFADGASDLSDWDAYDHLKRSSWAESHHWWLKIGALVLTGLLALTASPLFVWLFLIVLIWMSGVFLFSLRGKYWMGSRRRRYAAMTAAQREEMERGMVYAYEARRIEASTILSVNFLNPDNPTYVQAANRKIIAYEGIRLGERWRAELRGVPMRPYSTIRKHWMDLDPEWKARELAEQEAEEREREVIRIRREEFRRKIGLVSDGT